MKKSIAGADVRTEIKKSGVLFWKIADFLGCSDTTFSKKLRHSFTEEEFLRIQQAIEELKPVE